MEGAAVDPEGAAEGAATGPQRLLDVLRRPLERRRAAGLLRGLTRSQGGVDLCSNDYLGLARCAKLEAMMQEELARCTTEKQVLGSTGSRLLTGNSAYCEELEQELAAWCGAQSALLFNSGYDLNLGFFACVPQPGDVVVYDELMHNSVREGLRLSRGTAQPFKHNDPQDLERVLALLAAQTDFTGNVIVSVESVYSMDGHVAPLRELADVCQRHGASLVVDEAHGVGVFGATGAGLVSSEGMEARVLCRVVTFGKAPGAHGAVLVGPSVLREYMLNYCRPLIYSTALPPHSLAAIRAAQRLLSETAPALQAGLQERIARFQERAALYPALAPRLLESPTAIQGVLVPGNAAVSKLAFELREAGFEILPIRSPTVPAGTERLRIILHADNAIEDVDRFVDVLSRLAPESTAAPAL